MVVRPPTHVGRARRKGAGADGRQEEERFLRVLLVRDRDDLNPLDCARHRQPAAALRRLHLFQQPRLGKAGVVLLDAGDDEDALLSGVDDHWDTAKARISNEHLRRLTGGDALSYVVNDLLPQRSAPRR